MNPEQQLALDDVLAGRNVFITGAGGVGKSFLIGEIVSRKPVGLTAMTGCAALLIGGQTLHAFLGIGLGKDPAKRLAQTTRVRMRLMCLETLVIDEISMMSDKLFETVDEFLRLVRKCPRPFGGVQLVLVGDPFQLCPVDGTYCFASPTWARCDLVVHRLETNMRQRGDPIFKGILDRVRWGGCGPEDLAVLERLKETQFPEGIKPTRLYSKNVSVDAINLSELEDLGAPVHEFETWAPTPEAKRFVSANRIPEKVRVCVGAQVMCTKNFPELGLANGSRGVITAVDPNWVSFKKVSGAVVRVPLYEPPLVAVRYMPLKLAWAVTIHSAQGLTIDALEVDLGRDIFAAGQAYTGLSRATSLASVRVVNVLPESFVASPLVKNFPAHSNNAHQR